MIFLLVIVLYLKISEEFMCSQVKFLSQIFKFVCFQESVEPLLDILRESRLS